MNYPRHPAVEEPEPSTTPAKKEVHPLEALFKRAPPSSANATEASPLKPTPIKTSFSFFGGNGEDENEEDVDDTVMTVPQTPFTAQELEWRRKRSPAPTPDTAAINRKFSYSMMGKIDEDESDSDDDSEHGDEDEAEEEGDATPGAKKAFERAGLGISSATDGGEGRGKEGESKEEREESEFAKWFWENRGDTNRAWKRRRREAMKVKRKRENRRLTRRVV